MRVLSRLGTLSLGLATAMTLGAKPTAAAPPGATAFPGQIVFAGFTSGPDEQADIYSVSPLGGPTTDITPDPLGWQSEPAWSPDGRQIAYVGDGIHVVNADGTGDTLILSGENIPGGPKWSPDGSRIAFFMRDENSNTDVYAMNPDGSGIVRLTTNLQVDLNPSWSPDGTQIVFESWRDGGNNIYVMNADGSAQTRISFDPGQLLKAAKTVDGGQI